MWTSYSVKAWGLVQLEFPASYCHLAWGIAQVYLPYFLSKILAKLYSWPISANYFQKCFQFIGKNNVSERMKNEREILKTVYPISFKQKLLVSALPLSITRRILYLAIVRPILEYGSVTWHPLNTTLTNRLEACQRFAARVILQSWNLSHEDLLQKSNLPLLSKRRDYATLCHLYKILHHLSSSPNPYNPHPRPSLRNLNSRAVVPPFCRLTLCQKSFYPYAPTLWNYLPEDIIQCNSLQSFKSALRSHLG